MVKLVYTRDLKSLGRKTVRVRPPPAAQYNIKGGMAKSHAGSIPALGTKKSEFNSDFCFYINL